MFCKKILAGLVFVAFSATSIIPLHNTSRYFPFLEKPEEYITKGRSYICPSLFFTSAATAFKSGGGNRGIPELWGKYDLRDVIASINATRSEAYNPFTLEPGYVDWNSKAIKFFVDGKIKSQGLILDVEQNLFKSDFSLGFLLPVMHVNTLLRFTFDRENSNSTVSNNITSQEIDMLDRIRRSVHQELGLQGNDWSKSGIGDIDLHLKWRQFFDHALKMTSIDLNLQVGLLCPTGTKSHNDYPSSVPFMGNGHWGTYFDLVTEFELKQNWKLGFMGGLAYQFKKKHNVRIPYLGESALFSAIVGDIEVDPGLTFKVSPYFTLENMMDGLNFQLRYAFLKHSADTLQDKRADKTVPSYLSAEGADGIRSEKRNLSERTSHYLTMQVIYDSREAMKNWSLYPTFYLVYDYPLSGKNISKTHQLTCGVELHLW